MKLYVSTPKANTYFSEKEIAFDNAFVPNETFVINVHPEAAHQTVLGFGGSFTESSAYNYSRLSDEQKKAFLEAYFDPQKGIAYNFGRTHINSCDFSLGIYTYVQDGDKTLESFDISRDKQYIIPFIKDAMKYCGKELILFASPWSPPAYMKDNNSPIRGGKLLDEYKQTWAHYYAKYVKAYAAEGITISAISIQNEPNAVQPWESCYYSAEDEAELIEKYLTKALDEEGLSDLKIIIWDHNKERVYDRAKATLAKKEVYDRVWAVGHHWYSGDHFDSLTMVDEQLKKPVICTEFCCTIYMDVYQCAELYAKEIAGNFNHRCIGSCDWNLLLDQFGGPYHNRSDATVFKAGNTVLEDRNSGCYAPVLYDFEKKELIFTPIYYYIGHFSKFVKRGAVQIGTTKYADTVTACAFKNPDGEIVLVVMNAEDYDQTPILHIDGKAASFTLPAHSIATLII